MLIALHEVKHNVHLYTWSEAFAECYIRSEAMCSLLYL